MKTLRKRLFPMVALLLTVCFALLAAVLGGCASSNPDSGNPEPHSCGHVCPICGKCTSDCEDPVCADKCKGHTVVPPEEQEFVKIPIVGTDRFEFDIMAGYGVVENATFVSDNTTGNWVSDFSWKNSSKITLRVWSEEQCQTDVIVTVRMTEDILTLTNKLSVVLDNEVLESEGQVPASSAGAEAQFYEVNLGRFTLSQGNNTFELYAQDTIENFDIRSMVLYTDGVDLGWTEDVSAGKQFSAIDDRVTITGDYMKNTVQNAIGCKGYSASSATFTVYASRDAMATVSLAMSSMATVNTLTDYYTFRINGERKTSAATTPYSTVQWANYRVVAIGEYPLKAGANTISFEVGPVEWYNSFNIRALFIDTDATVDWEEVESEQHVCISVCSLCGKCENFTCDDPACAVKCDCSVLDVSALHEKVDVRGGIVKDTEAGYVKVTDYAAFDLITFTVIADQAGKAELSFCVGGNTVADWTFVDYFRVWVNDEGARTADANYVGNRLSKEIYTVKTVQGAYDVFSWLKLGEIELQEGENEIVLGYTCVGSADFRFNVKGMKLKSNEISLALGMTEPPHECSSVCPVCGKCTDADCTEYVCASKCDCTAYDFLATDDMVASTSGIDVAGEYAVISLGDNFQLLVYTVNASSAGKASLAFAIGGTEGIFKFTDKVRIWVNDERAREADADYAGNRLTGGEYTVEGAATQFYEIAIGVIDLKEGNNEIVLGFAGDCAVNLKAMTLKTQSVLSMLQTEDYFHECGHVCPVCGGCQDETCENAVCAAKCRCTTTEFKITDNRVTLSSNVENGAFKNSAGYVDLADPAAQVTVTFTVNSSAAGKATLAFNVSGNPNNPDKWTFVDFFRVWVNAQKDETSAYGYNEADKLSKEVYTIQTVYAPFTTFGYVVLGEIELKAGVNLIALGYTFAGSFNNRFNVKGMSLKGPMTLTYAGVHECGSVCPICGGCTDPDCTEQVCAVKCSCKTSVFNAVDDQTVLSAGLTKDVAGNCVRTTDYAASTTIGYRITASAAGKAILIFNISGNETADWTFVDYFRVWVNAQKDETSAYGYLEADKLSKETYTAKTVQGSWEVFGDVVLGVVDLKEGENEIVLGYTSVGNAAYRFNVRSMSLKTTLTLSYSQGETV